MRSILSKDILQENDDCDKNNAQEKFKHKNAKGAVCRLNEHRQMFLSFKTSRKRQAADGHFSSLHT
jgi:hypothetical protein